MDKSLQHKTSQTQQYQIIQKGNLEDLEEAVNLQLRIGWVCEGSAMPIVKATSSSFYQTLIRETYYNKQSTGPG